MNVALRRSRMTEAEFLAWAEAREERYEFDGREPVAMVGSTLRHSRIQMRLVAALQRRLQGTRYEVVGSDTFLRVGGVLRLADAAVIEPKDRDDLRVLDDPVAVFEILSDSTADVDRVTKAGEYWLTPSILHYTILDQDQAAADVLSRGASGWRPLPVGPGGSIELPALGIGVPLAEVYDGLRMSPSAVDR